MASKIQNNNTSLEEILATINALPEEGSGGVELPELSNPGSASTMLSGTEMIDGSGNKVTGTIETKTSSNLTVSGATVTVPTGYYASQATKSVATATQATPSVSIDSAGKITATATQTAGYVNAGTKTGTKQLTTQAAKTITPTKSSQTAVASGRYTTGVVTVAAIPDAYQDVTGVDAVATDVVEGKKIVNSSGETVTGTNPYVKATTDTEVNSQTSKLAELKTILEGKAAGGGSAETCTVNININNGLEWEVLHSSGRTPLRNSDNNPISTALTVKKGEVIHILGGDSDMRYMECDNCELIFNDYGLNDAGYYICSVRIDGNAVITLV